MRGEDNFSVLDPKLGPPKRSDRYAVVFKNDDYTPMEFVVRVLTRHFALAQAEATEIMMKVHTQGEALVRVFNQHDVAETKAVRVMDDARKEGHPFRVVVQPV